MLMSVNPQTPEEGVGYLGAEVTGCYEPEVECSDTRRHLLLLFFETGSYQNFDRTGVARLAGLRTACLCLTCG